jgi:RNA polymerase sigma-70 factor (ECF subfamily)
MHDQTARLAGSLVTVDEDLEREFETRLVESSTLAFRVAYGVLRHRQDAEDVAQEAFVKAYRSFRDLRDRERFRAWLVRMTWRLAIDRQRNDRRRAARDRSPEGLRHVADVTQRLSPSGRESAVAQGFSPAVVVDLEARERAGRLWAAIDALPDKLRVAIVLANIEEHDIAEVARLLDLPEGTVKSRLFLARQRLKELLQ